MKAITTNAVLKDQGARSFFVKYRVGRRGKEEVWTFPKTGRSRPSPEVVLTAFHTYMQRERLLPGNSYEVSALSCEYPDITDDIVSLKYEVPGGPNPTIVPTKEKHVDQQTVFPGFP